MAISVEYVAKETANNLRRNLLMSSAAVMCVAVSLAMVGMALLLKQGVSNASVQWKKGVEISIFMKFNPPATESENRAIAAELDSSPEVARVTYVDQNAALREFKKMMGGSPALMEATGAADLPPSYRVVLKRPELIQQLEDRFETRDQVPTRPGVYQVVDSKQAVAGLLGVTRVLQIGLLFFASVLLFSAALLILNTIRMAIFSRRREVAVMKLVGATDWFIRIPFMVEGTLQGVAGGLLAFGFIYSLRGFLISSLPGQYQAFRPLIVTSAEAVGSGLFITLVGAAVGAVGSAVALGRFLDV